MLLHTQLEERVVRHCWFHGCWPGKRVSGRRERQKDWEKKRITWGSYILICQGSSDRMMKFWSEWSKRFHGS